MLGVGDRVLLCVFWVFTGTISLCVVVFFFQAEDGIRDIGVTGVQTCALPISRDPRPEGAPVALLEVENLQTYLYSRRGENHAVDGVSFTLDSGQSLGLVGESGSGKSMTALSILRLVPQPAARIVGGSVRFGGEDLLAKSEAEMQRLRGGEIAIILQDPLTSLNPLYSIGFQVGEAVRFHQHLS